MRRPSVFDAKPLTIVPPAEAGKVEQVAAKPTAELKPKKDLVKTSLYLAPAVHDLLREVAFHERKKVHDLVLEGVEHVLKTRRHPSITEIAGKA